MVGRLGGVGRGEGKGKGGRGSGYPWIYSGLAPK